MTLSAAAGTAAAQGFAAKAVRIIVPYAPAGGTAIITRALAQGDPRWQYQGGIKPGLRNHTHGRMLQIERLASVLSQKFAAEFFCWFADTLSRSSPGAQPCLVALRVSTNQQKNSQTPAFSRTFMLRISDSGH